MAVFESSFYCDFSETLTFLKIYVENCKKARISLEPVFIVFRSENYFLLFHDSWVNVLDIVSRCALGR